MIGSSDDPALDAYLAAVAAALERAGEAPEVVREILDGLRDHALEAAAETGDMAAAIARLDPPEAFGPAPAAPATDGEEGDRRTLGILSVVLCAAAGVAGAALFSEREPFDTPSSGLAFLVGLGAALAAGAVAWRTLWGRFGALSAGGVLTIFFAIWALLLIGGGA